MDKTKLSHEPQMPVRLRLHIDEAWRGPLAGPVSVWCILALAWIDTSNFQDSKTLTAKKRESLYTKIIDLENKNKITYWSGRSSNQDIDTYWIIQSLQKASIQAVFICIKKYFFKEWGPRLSKSVYWEDQIALFQLQKLFSKRKATWPILEMILHIPNTVARIETLIIDGNHTFWLDVTLDINVVTIIKWDRKNSLISMASIVAKVERDSYMHTCSKKFPEYNLDKHKWYWTKKHRELISEFWISDIHRRSFCQNISVKKTFKQVKNKKKTLIPSITSFSKSDKISISKEKPKLLLHICCAPDLAWPLHWLKNHFKLYLFWYNPNIHPRKEHTKRYDSFIKLIWLEKGDYEIIEDRYDPKEFFDAMVSEREDIDPKLKDASAKETLKVAWEMEERSSRCNPCYSMRLAEAAKNAAKHDIPYFTSTLLISPKKKMDKLFQRWIEWERRHPSTKFLRFNFAKNKWYEMATKLTKKHKLFRQNYCGCGRTIPKKWEENSNYSWG